MVDMRYVAAGGILAVLAAYLYLSQGGDVIAPATSPGGYVSGDIPVSGGDGTTYYFPPEAVPVFPTPEPFDWSMFLSQAPAMFEQPALPDGLATSKKEAAGGGEDRFGVAGGWGGGGAGAVKTAGPLSNVLDMFAGIVGIPAVLGAKVGIGAAAVTGAGDMSTLSGGGVGGRGGPDIPLSTKESLVYGLDASQVPIIRIGGTTYAAVTNDGIPMSDDVAEFLHAGAGGAAKKTGTTSSGGTVYTHASGARSVVSQGQITGGTSRALDAHDIARLPASQREALGY